MKFLQIPNIDNLNELLSFKTASGHYVNGRIEVYSCKVAGTDKKLYKYLQNKYSEDEAESRALATSSAQPSSSPPSPPGPLSENSSRRILFYLISTLNASFPDYDFRSLIASEFTKFDNIADVINTVNTTLFNVGCPNLLQHRALWREIDSVIDLDDCQLFAYTPDPESDPYGDDFPVWSFNLFFFNRKLKRILFFTCCCSSESHSHSELNSYASFASINNELANPDEVFIL